MPYLITFVTAMLHQVTQCLVAGVKSLTKFSSYGLLLEQFCKKVKATQEKVVLLLQCIAGRIQRLLAAAPIHLSRKFAKQHDKAISTAVAATLQLVGDLNERDKLLMQRKVSNHGLGLRSIEEPYLHSFFLLTSCGRSSQSNKRFHTL